MFKVSSGKKRTAFRYAGQTKTAQSHQTRRLSAVLSQVPEREIVWCARYWIPTMQAFARIYWPNQTATANTTTQYNFPSGADSIANGVQKPCLRRLSLSPNLVFLPIRRETHGCQLPRSSCRQQISQSLDVILPFATPSTFHGVAKHAIFAGVQRQRRSALAEQGAQHL